MTLFPAVLSRTPRPVRRASLPAGGRPPQAHLPRLRRWRARRPAPPAKPLAPRFTRHAPRSTQFETGGRSGPARFAFDLASRPFALLHNPAAARGPQWEAASELAELLELPESKLNALCREVSGLTAREWWDVLRVGHVKEKVREEIEYRLLDETFARKVRGGGDSFEAVRLTPSLLLGRVRLRRREDGWTRQGAAWNLGFKNHARLQRAVYYSLGLTLAELEAGIVGAVLDAWEYNPITLTIYPPDRVLNEKELRAHGATFLKFGARWNQGYWRGARVPDEEFKIGNPSGKFKEFATWDEFTAYCKDHKLDVRKVVSHTFGGRANGRTMLKFLGLYTPECEHFKVNDMQADA
ncbi:MAG: hypothetical protein HY291_17370 [Planctomycetes bacterium]|nr:hypothetical protein [Planctomycetota bacterium]